MTWLTGSGHFAWHFHLWGGSWSTLIMYSNQPTMVSLHVSDCKFIIIRRLQLCCVSYCYHLGWQISSPADSPASAFSCRDTLFSIWRSKLVDAETRTGRYQFGETHPNVLCSLWYCASARSTCLIIIIANETAIIMDFTCICTRILMSSFWQRFL